MTETFDPSKTSGPVTLSGGNLTATTGTAAYEYSLGETLQSGRKIYFEFTIVSVGIGALSFGLANASQSLTAGNDMGSTTSVGYSMNHSAFEWTSQKSASLGTLTVGSVIGVAWDGVNGNLWMVGPSGLWDGSGTDNPATNTGGLNGSAFYNGGLSSFIAAGAFAAVAVYQGSKITANFGATSFSYSIPSGFEALNTEAWNPGDKATNATLSNNNLTMTTTPAAYSGVRNVTSQGSGRKIYFEITINSVGGTGALIVGMATSALALTTACGYDVAGDSVGYSLFTGGFVFQGASITASLGTLTVGSVIGVAMDFSNDNIWMVGPSGLWDGSGTDNPATNTGGLNTASFFHGNLTAGVFGAALFACMSAYNGSQGTANFGSSAFTYSIPSGFQALNNNVTTSPISGTAAALTTATGTLLDLGSLSGTAAAKTTATGVLTGTGGVSEAFVVIMA